MWEDYLYWQEIDLQISNASDSLLKTHYRAGA
jgi:hypothetical protein